MYGFCGPSELFFLVIIGLIIVGAVWWRRREQGQRFDPAVQKSAVGVAASTEESPTTFADVQRRAEALRLQVQNGQLAEAECKQRMRDLMLQDADGVWWMVGYESGAWYHHDGNDWVRDDAGPEC